MSPRTRPCCLGQWQQVGNRRFQSNEAAIDLIYEDGKEELEKPQSRQFPPQSSISPSPDVALRSSKLAALHARLSLPKKLPLQTMGRALVDPSADPDPRFNNTSLAQVGGALLSYHVSEWLLCHYPRLPMTVLFAATYAYNGPPTLTKIAQEWGVETVAFPGPEVDPGLLQFTKLKPGDSLPGSSVKSIRPDYSQFYRRGISSRNVYDDEFGDTIPKEDVTEAPQATETAYSNFVKAVIGAVYLHAGRVAARNFVKAHILSRHLEISSLFAFESPVRELARLCQREEFEYPVARILSETGRHSRSPVFVVGIYSGTEKLGEGAGPGLIEARLRASVAALKAWYLYSPGNNQPLPSSTEDANAAPWQPVHIDGGEIIH
jgi:dsRNA-specific ribonuclease